MTYIIIRPSQKCGGFFMPDPDHLWAHSTLLVAQNRADNNPTGPETGIRGTPGGIPSRGARGILSAQI